MIKYWSENSIYAFSYKNIYIFIEFSIDDLKRKKRKEKKKQIN